MSYPQTQATEAVLRAQDYWRLYTQVITSGDIYELDTSVRAIAIGPNSDLHSVRVYYYDPSNNPVQANELVVGVGSPFVGRLDSLLDQQYPMTNGIYQVAGLPLYGSPSPARAFVVPNDIVHDNWLPVLYPIDPADIVAFERPRLDLLAYLVDPPVLPNKRAERRVRSLVPVNDRGAGWGATYFKIPHYRRKRLEVRLVSNASQYDVRVVGVTLSVQGGAANTETLIEDFPIVNVPGTTTSKVYRSMSNVVDGATLDIGYFDYIYVVLFGDAAHAPTQLVELNVLSTDEE